MGESTLDQISSHLAFLGYEITQRDESVRATHPTKYNLLLKPFRGGVLFACFFGGSDRARSDPGAFLEFINSLNAKAALTRFYADDDRDLVIECWHPDHYDRLLFGRFLDLLERDTGLLMEADRSQDFLR